MTLQARPFRAVRFNEKRFGLGRVLSPPYDVFTPALEKRLRRVPNNAIHLELPAGPAAERYRKSRKLWEIWLKTGALVRDETPAYYAVEQGFRFRGRAYARTGFLCALGLDAATAKRVLRHERTLSKPKADRTRVLKTMRANTSPIFGIYPDAGGRLRRELAAAKRGGPLAAGRDIQGVRCRMWRIDDPSRIAVMERALKTKKLLIADGHHRYEAARDFWRRGRVSGAGFTLAYLVAQEDAGLIVNPTHRVVRPTERVLRDLERRCAGIPVRGLKPLIGHLARSRSPYAFGLYNGTCRLMAPAPGEKGVPSRFGLDWLARRILCSVDPQDISYFHEAREAMREAKKRRALAFLGRPFSVADIRRAVERAGLLPQKSTYFFPKIGSGIAFRPF